MRKAPKVDQSENRDNTNPPISEMLSAAYAMHKSARIAFDLSKAGKTDTPAFEKAMQETGDARRLITMQEPQQGLDLIIMLASIQSLATGCAYRMDKPDAATIDYLIEALAEMHVAATNARHFLEGHMNVHLSRHNLFTLDGCTVQ